MSLRRPAMNRSLNRQNPDILIMMIAEKQIIKGGEDDKRDQRAREEMGPVKPATEMSGTTARSSRRTSIYSGNQLSNISKTSGLSREVPYSGSSFFWWVITPLLIKERMN